VLVVIGVALFLANTINVGADLSGMADVLHLLTGIANGFWVVLFGGAIIFATMRFRYATIGRVFKWLAAFLFAYVLTAFLVHPNWGQIASATLHPPPITTRPQLSTLVAILGTTISPYLFFWQAAQEIEEEKARGHTTLESRQGATHAEIVTRKLDVGLGAFFSNMIMFFIILTAALTLHAHNLTSIETSRDAVKALEPLAGRFAAMLYATGLIGVGFLAIPTLAGSAAYAFSETFGYRQGLDEKVHRARAFYGIISISIVGGVLLTFTKINPMDALYWTAVINGVLAPFLLVGILLVASDKKIMRGQPSSLLGRIVVGVTAFGMFAAAFGLFLL
jgi:Mn2+/Fe2+ NRAMP family transporter